MLVKICGITNLEDAKAAVGAGADFIGIIFHRDTKRYLDDERAISLIQELQNHPIHVVGVFLEDDLMQVAKKAKDLELEWVQVVAPASKKELEPLEKFRKLLVVEVNFDGSYEPLTYTLDKRDFLIYDCATFGSGQSFDWNQFKRIEQGAFLLAGGLTPSNVQEAIKIIKPNGVDVASGVCNSSNVKKDATKIREFIAQSHE
ncbi:MAG: N-(5'-phosphoribosyl)anthranilate isomerase [Chlamydiae bacterium]|nr:N-(5'-phosphoribosyl)anthranilate isomerase [Chlamydiota bacterium]